MRKRLLNIGVAMLQLLHMLLTFGGGDPKVALSARIGRQVARDERWAEIADFIISTILFDHPNHCLRIYEQDKARRQGAGQHDY